jgi:hypothetical protein
LIGICLAVLTTIGLPSVEKLYNKRRRERNMIARRRRYFRGRDLNPSKGHLPKARIHVLLMRANDLSFGAKNLRKEISVGP